MIYLIAQMSVALALAGILGAAIGWLVHRSAHVRRLDEYQHALSRAQNQAAQTESEVAMLADDYDELERRSKTEINALRSQTQQIPELSSNLEKSQLLVRQLLQKHESKVRDLSTENAALSAKLKSITDREQAYDKVKIELDNIRKQKVADNSQQNDASAEDQESAESEGSAVNVDDSITSDLEFDESITVDGLDESIASNEPNESITSDEPNESITSDELDESIAANELDESNSNEAVELLDATVVSGPADDFINQLNEATRLPISDARLAGSWASASLTIDADRKTSESIDTGPEEITVLHVAPNDKARTESLDDDVLISDHDHDSDDPFDSVMEVGDELQRELDIDADSDPLLDGSSDNASLFEFDPVERKDDLQQIFGIGPVTEKALNDLGITSYSQLADLKSHEIEKIAGALEIVPGRIERDDWVGNARRQLEDVLEEL